MSTFIVITVITALALGLMMLGLSITQIRKGRPMQGDVGDNDHMKALGIQCAAKQFRHEEMILKGDDCDAYAVCDNDCGEGCSTCSSHHS